MADQEETGENADLTHLRPWELLRSGDFDLGIQIMREEYEAGGKFKARETLRLGIGYMWAEMYDAAATHFTAAAHAPFNGESEFAFAGVAEWHLGNKAVAIQRWREGLKAQYAVGCRVCSMTARFLVVASAIEPDRISEQEAERLLLDATERLDPSRWGGALGRFILGQIEMGEMEAHWIGNIDRGVKGMLPRRVWLTDFYDAARRLNRAEIDPQAFRLLMRPLADVANSEKTDIGTFIDILRNPEYFFARTEAAKSVSSN